MEEPSKNNCRSWEENTYWKHFHSVNFCQILPTGFQHELIFPEKFTENMKGYLPEKVALKGPNEVTWNVNLSKANERAVFQGGGWKGFVKAYSLKKADILSFKYNRNECFEVLIFDGSNLCEKEASYFERKFQKPKDNDEHVEKSIENPSEEVTERSKEQENDSENTPRNNYGKRMTRAGKSYFSDKPAQNRDGLRKNQQEEEPQTSDEEFSASEEQISMEDTDGTPKNAVRARTGETPSNSSRKRNRSAVSAKKTSGRKRWPEICYRSNRRPVTEAEKEKALQMAQVRASKYEDPFLVIMRPTAAYRRFFMSIPREWRPKRFFKKTGEELILKVKDKTWACKFCATCNNGGLQTGWKKFACDNFLEEFDVCLFVPANKKIDGLVVLDVSIFRVVPEVVPPSIITP